MAAPLGMLLKIKSLGVASASKKMAGFNAIFAKMGKKMGPMLKQMNKGFGKFALIAGGAFATLIAASPLLRARMEILTLRIRELVRVFGDALAPIIETITGLVESATAIWKNLPEPMQQAILFGTQVVAVLGLLAIAFAFLTSAMFPVTLAILAIVGAAAALYLIWTQNLGGVQDIVKNVFGNIQKVLEGFVNFFKAIFAGDLQGAWDAIVGIFQAGVELVIDWFTFVPRAILGLIDFLTGGVVTKFLNAGKELFGAFIKGLQKGLADAGGLIADLLGLLMDFLGGSLPEKGPLMKVPSAGRTLGQAYVSSFGEGLAMGNIGSVVERQFNIDTVALSIPGATEEGTSEFLTMFEKDISRAVLR